MSNIQLMRIVKPVLVHGFGFASIDTRAETVCVKFTDNSGRVVSLGFDGRCDTEAETGSMVRETYSLFADSPVIADRPDGRSEQSGSTRTALRFLRDALNQLDLD